MPNQGKQPTIKKIKVGGREIAINWAALIITTETKPTGEFDPLTGSSISRPQKVVYWVPVPVNNSDMNDPDIKQAIMFNIQKVTEDDGDNPISATQGELVKLKLSNDQILQDVGIVHTMQVAGMTQDEVEAHDPIRRLIKRYTEDWDKTGQMAANIRHNIDLFRKYVPKDADLGITSLTRSGERINELRNLIAQETDPALLQDYQQEFNSLLASYRQVAGRTGNEPAGFEEVKNRRIAMLQTQFAEKLFNSPPEQAQALRNQFELDLADVDKSIPRDRIPLEGAITAQQAAGLGQQAIQESERLYQQNVRRVALEGKTPIRAPSPIALVDEELSKRGYIGEDTAMIARKQAVLPDWEAQRQREKRAKQWRDLVEQARNRTVQRERIAKF